MSKHIRPLDPQEAQRRLKSYVSGFALSLVFTLIPYFLVVHESLKGSILLTTIIGFAALQLVIQLVFFLHLGREPKQQWNLVFLMNTFGIILVVVGGSLTIMTHLRHNLSGPEVANMISADEGIHQVQGAQTVSCSGVTGTNHEVILKNNSATPRHTDAKLCDTLNILNEDSDIRLIAFGQHDHHIQYAGHGEQFLKQGVSEQITFTETGTYIFHDHIQDKIKGDFTVTP